MVVVVDARACERSRGWLEAVDAVVPLKGSGPSASPCAWHIPGRGGMAREREALDLRGRVDKEKESTKKVPAWSVELKAGREGLSQGIRNGWD